MNVPPANFKNSEHFLNNMKSNLRLRASDTYIYVVVDGVDGNGGPDGDGGELLLSQDPCLRSSRKVTKKLSSRR